MVKISQGYDIDQLVRVLERARIGEGAKVKLRVSPSEELKSILETALEFHADIPPIEIRSMISKAMHQVARRRRITAEQLLRAMRKEEQTYLAIRPRTFHVVSSLSATLPGYQSISFVRSRLILSNRLSTRFRDPDLEKVLKWREQVRCPTGYCWVRYEVQARSPHAAFSSSEGVLEAARGVWNYVLNRHVGSRLVSGKRRHINPIQKGPVQTVHESDGRPAVDGFWEDQTCWAEAPPIDLRSSFSKMRNEAATISRRIQATSYQRDLLRAFKWYASALDGIDHENSYIKLWSLLEFLTSTQRMPYERTIRRVAFVMRDLKHHLQVLRHLKEIRNRMVHTTMVPLDMQARVIQLKSYVESILRFLMWIDEDFDGLGKVGEFLDLPVDRGSLQAKRRALSVALAVRSD